MTADTCVRAQLQARAGESKSAFRSKAPASYRDEDLPPPTSPAAVLASAGSSTDGAAKSPLMCPAVAVDSRSNPVPLRSPSIPGARIDASTVLLGARTNVAAGKEKKQVVGPEEAGSSKVATVIPRTAAGGRALGVPQPSQFRAPPMPLPRTCHSSSAASSSASRKPPPPHPCQQPHSASPGGWGEQGNGQKREGAAERGEGQSAQYEGKGKHDDEVLCPSVSTRCVLGGAARDQPQVRRCSMQALLDAGLVHAGPKVLRVMRNGRALFGDLLSDSQIRYSADNLPQRKDILFQSPSGFGNHCGRILDSKFRYSNGFTMVWYSADGLSWEPLDNLRQRMQERFPQHAEQAHSQSSACAARSCTKGKRSPGHIERASERESITEIFPQGSRCEVWCEASLVDPADWWEALVVEARGDRVKTRYIQRDMAGVESLVMSLYPRSFSTRHVGHLIRRKRDEEGGGDREEGGERRQNETGEEEEPIYRLRDDDGGRHGGGVGSHKRYASTSPQPDVRPRKQGKQQLVLWRRQRTAGGSACNAVCEERELPRCLVPQGTALEAVRQVREEVEQVIECSVCMERPAATCFVSCGHLFCCDQTCGSSKTRTCPICLVPVEGKVKVFGPMQAQVLKSLFSLYIIYCILHIIYTTTHQYILSEITAY